MKPALALVALLALPVAAPAAARSTVATADPAPLAGKGDFLFSGWAGPPLRVFYQVPETVTAKTPVLFVFHGVKRDADVYRDAWARRAVERGFIVVAPQFSRADFPDDNAYSSGGMVGEDGTVRPRETWSYAAIEPLFDTIRARTGTRVPHYILYGHSGGAQFVQRFTLFMPDARFARAIAANAGWYTLPDFDTPFPYGLKGAPIDAAGLKTALSRPLWILLGGKDTDPASPNLRKTRLAEKQGPYRLARGDFFYRTAQAAAATLGVPLAWQRRYVNGIGHDNAGMSAATAPLVR